jgi:YgiT-type zinc finger domain-containing protein
MRSLPAEYGTCPCAGTYENRSVEVRMTVGGKAIVLENIPQGACPLCGSRVYKTEVLECLEALMRQRELDPRDV